jgi:hypothetical protein
LCHEWGEGAVAVRGKEERRMKSGGEVVEWWFKEIIVHTIVRFVSYIENV